MTQTITRITTPYGHTFMATAGNSELVLPDGSSLFNADAKWQSLECRSDDTALETPELRRELCWRRMNGSLVLADGTVTMGATLALVTATWRFGDESFSRLFVPSLCLEGYGRIADREVPPPSDYPWAGRHGASIPLAWWMVPLADAFARVSRAMEIAERARLTLVAMSPEAVDIDPQDDERMEVWRLVTWMARDSGGLLVVDDDALAPAVKRPTPVVEAEPPAPTTTAAPSVPSSNRNGSPSIPRARV